MQEKPSVSIIVPTYNREGTLPQTIESVLQQTYKNWSLYIVDDGSTDNTESLILKYSMEDGRIHYLLNTGKKGPAAARNFGICTSDGDYIAFLDSDDQWFSNHLEDSIAAIEEENVDVCFSLWVEKHKDGTVTKMLETDYEKKCIKDVTEVLNVPIRKNRMIFTAPGFFEYVVGVKSLYLNHINTMVFKRDAIGQEQLFNEELRASEDMDFIFRTIYSHDFCVIKDFHFVYNQGEDNIHSFMDRRNIRMEELLINVEQVNRLTFCGLHKCKMYRLRKQFILKVDKIARKDKCILMCNTKLAIKYFTMGYINQKKHVIRAIVYLLMAIYYHPKMAKKTLAFKLLLHIVLPFSYKNIIIQPRDISLN